VLHFRCSRKKLRKKHHVPRLEPRMLQRPNLAAKSEEIRISTGLVYLCAAMSVVTVGRQSISMVCDKVLTREKHSGR
jgi:hypothetical protein